MTYVSEIKGRSLSPWMPTVTKTTGCLRVLAKSMAVRRLGTFLGSVLRSPWAGPQTSSMSKVYRPSNMLCFSPNANSFTWWISLVHLQAWCGPSDDGLAAHVIHCFKEERFMRLDHA
jgi:hypothetical protein